MVFLFLAGAALGGLAGYALGSWSRPGYYWNPYYSHPYYPPYYYSAGTPYSPYYYPTYASPNAWRPWYGYYYW